MPDSSLQIMPFDEEERTYIKERLKQERRLFWIVMRSLIGLGVLVVVVTTVVFEWMTNTADPEKQRLTHENFPDSIYLWSLLIVVIIISASGLLSYYLTLSKVVKDDKLGQKFVECTKVYRKVFNPRANSFYFYLESKAKLSIEVSAHDFVQYQVGDEINIKYGVCSKEYLGYY